MPSALQQALNLNCCADLTLGCWKSFFAPAKQDPSAVHGLKTGDLLLACSNKTGRSAAQILVGSCPWDHCGIVWVEKGVIYIIDSGSSRYYPFCSRPLNFDGKGDNPEWEGLDSGPQMYPLLEFLEEQGKHPLNVKQGDQGDNQPWYYERLGIRRLRKPLTENQEVKMRASILKMCDRPYENTAEMLAAAIDVCDCCCASFVNKQEDRSSLFCSELVAAIYIDTALLPAMPPANEYVPADFSEDHGNNISSLCGCCCFSWCLGRSCGIGDVRNNEFGGLLFEPCLVLESPQSPAHLLLAPQQHGKVAPQ